MSVRGRFFRRRGPGWAPDSVQVVLMDLGSGHVLEPIDAERPYVDVNTGDFLAGAETTRRDRALQDVRRRRSEHVLALEHLERVEAEIRDAFERVALPVDLDDEGAPGAGRAGA